MAKIIFKDEETGEELKLARYDAKIRELDNNWSQAAQKGNVDDADKAQYELINVAMADHKDYVKNRLGGSKFDTIDIVELGVLFLEVQTAYTMPLIAAQAAAEKRKFDAQFSRQAFKDVK